MLQANPHYAFVRYPNGGETTVSTKHLAPKPISAPQDQLLPRDSVLESTVRNSPFSVLAAHVQQEVPTATEQNNVTVGRNNPPVDALDETGILWIGLIFKGQGECRNRLYLLFVKLCWVSCCL